MALNRATRVCMASSVCERATSQTGNDLATFRVQGFTGSLLITAVYRSSPAGSETAEARRAALHAATTGRQDEPSGLALAVMLINRPPCWLLASREERVSDLLPEM